MCVWRGSSETVTISVASERRVKPRAAIASASTPTAFFKMFIFITASLERKRASRTSLTRLAPLLHCLFCGCCGCCGWLIVGLHHRVAGLHHPAHLAHHAHHRHHAWPWPIIGAWAPWDQGSGLARPVRSRRVPRSRLAAAHVRFASTTHRSHPFRLGFSAAAAGQGWSNTTARTCRSCRSLERTWPDMGRAGEEQGRNGDEPGPA